MRGFDMLKMQRKAWKSGWAGLCLIWLASMALGPVQAQAGATFSLGPTSPSVYENQGSITLYITRTPATGAATVDILTVEGSAKAGQNFVATNGTVSFSDGDVSKQITIGILDDQIPGGTKTFGVQLANPSGGGSLDVGQIAVSIFDSDAVVGFFATQTTVVEDVTNVVLAVTRNGDLSQRISVDYYTTDGYTTNYTTNTVGTNIVISTNLVVSAAGYTDYTPVQDTLVFDVGIGTNYITVPIIDDCKVQGTHFFNVWLTNAHGANIKASWDKETVNILDNDNGNGSFSFNGISHKHGNCTNVLEDTGTITVSVSRVTAGCNVSTMTTGTVSVAYRIWPGVTNACALRDCRCPGELMAQEGDSNDDWTLVGGSGTLTWADKDGKDKTFTLTINPDNRVEIDKTLVLELFDNGSLGGANINPRASLLPIRILVGDQAAGAADTNYNNATPFVPNPGANDTVRSVLVYPPGSSHPDSILTAGDFTAFNAQVRNGIARLGPAGQLDGSFNPGSGADGPVNSILLQPDNKVIIGGGFSSINNVSRMRVARLLDNGGLDSTFSPGSGADDMVMAMALRTDGKVIIAGAFNTVNAYTCPRIARLNSDGSVDQTFNPGLGTDGIIYSVAIYTNSSDPNFGKILIGGLFSVCDTNYAACMARLNTNGSFDQTFAPISGADGAVYAIALQSDGSILIGGAFATYDGESRNGIASLNPNGTLDETFNPGAGALGPVYDIKFQPNGLPVIAGDFVAYNNTPRLHIARLNTNGTLDTSFLDVYYNTNLPGTDQFISSVSLQSSGHMIIGGGFTQAGSGYTPLNCSPSIAAVRTQFYVTRLIGGDNPPANNAPGNVQIVSSTYSVDENTQTGVVAIQLERINGKHGSLKVYYATSNGTAVAGVDYKGVTNYYTWTDCVMGTTPIPITIPIINNNIMDGNRVFHLVLFSPSGVGPGGSTQPSLGFQTTCDITIIDDDVPHGALGFSQPIFGVNENGRNATITVVRTNGANGRVTVQYAAANGTALSGSAYTTNTLNTLTFDSGITNQTFSIGIVDDLAVQPERFLSLRLTNATGGASLGLSNATLLIFDNDGGSGSVSYVSNSFAVWKENDTNANAWRTNASVTVRRTSGTKGTVAVDAIAYELASGPGNARAWVNFIPVTNRLVFLAGVTSQTFQVAIKANWFVEGNQNFGLRLTNVSGGTIGFLTNAVMTILDPNSYGLLSFANAQYSVSELGSNAVITVMRVGGSADVVSVDYHTLPVTAATNVNYVPTNGTLVFPNGVTWQTFVVPVIHDPDLTGNLTAQLTLDNYAKASPGVITNASLLIIDAEALSAPAGTVGSDFAPVSGPNGFVHAVAVQEDGRSLIAGEFTAFDGVGRNRIARLNVDGSLDLAFKPGRGANDTIWAMVLQPDGNILVAGDFTTMGSLTATNRNHVARLDTVGNVDTSFNPGAGADGNISALAVQLDGKVLIGGAFSTYNNVSRQGIARLNTNGVIDLTFNPGTGANGKVYAVALQPDGKVLVGGSFVSVNSQPVANLARLNADGSLDATFQPGLGPDDAVRAIAVQFDGRVVIGGSFKNYNGRPSHYLARTDAYGSLDTNFNTGTGPDNTVYTVLIRSDERIMIGGEFTSYDSIYMHHLARLKPNGSVDPSINFGTGADSFIDAIVLQNDDQMVIGGGFTEFNDVPDRYVARLVGGDNFDAGSFQFSLPAYSVLENGTNITIEVLRVGGLSGNVGVDCYTGTEGTGLTNVDYVAVTTNLVFREGENRGTFSITVLPDPTNNADVTVFLHLANATGGATVTAPPDACLTIYNTSCELSFDTSAYSASEDVGSEAILNVVRTGATNGTVSVRYTTVDGTAKAGRDYIAVQGTNVFGPGVTNQTIRIPITNDLVFPEGNRVFSVQLMNPVSVQPSNAVPVVDVSLGAWTNVPVTIMENDLAPGQLSFYSSNYVVMEDGTNAGYSFLENSGNAVITVVRSNGSSGTVSVQYSAADRPGYTAQGGVNYVRTSGTLSFADGETLQTFNVPLINDNLPGSNVTIKLTLSNPGGEATIASPSNAVLTIAESTPYLCFFSFAATNFDVAANIQSNVLANISVLRTGAYLGPLSVAVNVATVAGGSAQVNSDYLATNGVLTFADQETNKIFQVSILKDDYPQDGLIEGGRTIWLTLSNPQPPACGLVLSKANLTILPDRVIGFETNNYSVSEFGDTLSVNLIRRELNPSQPVAVRVSTQDDTALAGQDYTGTNFVVTFGPSQTSMNLVLPIIHDDLLRQGTRSFQLTLAPGGPGLTNLTLYPARAVVNILDNDQPGGLLDTNFDPGQVLSGTVNTFARQTDGQYVIGGDFSVSGVSNRLARLGTNGALDTNFFASADRPVYAVGISQGGISHDGISAAQSWPITDGQQSEMHVTVTGPGLLTFWWKVSSQTNADYLEFWLDQVRTRSISGEVDWTQASMSLSAGQHLLSWRYVKDASLSSGADHGWVDQVSYVAQPQIVAQPSSSQIVTLGGTAYFSVDAIGTQPLSYQWRFNGADIQGQTGPSYTLSGVTAANAGSYSVVVANAAGSVTSASATLQVNLLPLAKDFQWVSQVGTNFSEVGGRVAVDALGNSYVIGQAEQAFSLGGFSLASGWFLAKFDQGGNVLWAYSTLQANDLAIDRSGSVYVAGTFAGTQPLGTNTLVSAGPSDIFVAKYSSVGNVLWAQRAGGALDDAANGVAVDRNGNVYVTGYYRSAATFGNVSIVGGSTNLPASDSNTPDVFVVRYDTSGNFRWAAKAGGSGSDAGQRIVVAPNGGNVYVAGTFMGSSVPFGSDTFNVSAYDTQNVFLSKLNSSGQFVWTQQEGGYMAQVGGLGVDSSENIYLAMNLNQSSYISGSTYAGYSMQVVSYSSGHVLRWMSGTYLGSLGSRCLDLAVDSSGNSFMAGWFNGVISLGTANLISSTNASSPSQPDVFVFMHKGDGSELWSVQAGGVGSDQANGVAVDSTGANVYLSGQFSGVSVSFGTNILNSAGNNDMFVAKLADRLPPIIVQHPQSLLVSAGQTAVFTVVAAGRSPLAYQWYWGSVALANQTNATLTLSNVTSLIAGGYYVVVSNGDGTATSGVAQLTVDVPSTLASALNTSGLSWISASSAPWIARSANEILVGGAFSLVNSQTHNHLARLAGDGSTISTYLCTNVNNTVYALAQYADGHVLLGGAFTLVNTIQRNFLVRLTMEGLVDQNFVTGLGPSGPVRAIALQPDGKIVIGGDFTTVNGVPQGHVARINTDGSLDTGFGSSMAGANNQVFAVAVCTNGTNAGKIILGGTFTSVNGASRNRIARLNADGSLDLSFDPRTGPNDTIDAVLLEPIGRGPDGQGQEDRVLIGGSFTAVQGVPCNRIARLTANGDYDPSINFGTGANGLVTALGLEPDGKIVLAGGFTLVNGVARNGFARLEAGLNFGAGSFVFGSPAYPVAENGGSVTVTVVRQGGLSNAVSVTYGTSDGTARAGVDYTNVSGRFDFAVGQSTTNFTVGIRDNTIVDGDRTVNLILSAPTGGAVLGYPSNAVLTILDNDSLIQFASTSYVAVASDGSATISVTRRGGLTGTASVGFATTNGTAQAGVNYAATNGTLVFGPGVSNVTFPVPLIESGVPGPALTVGLMLSNIMGAAALGAQTNAILLILNDNWGAGSVSFTTNSYLVPSGASNVAVTVIRSAGSSGIIAVTYSTADNTAVGGVDYLPANGLLIFGDGETNKIVRIAILAGNGLGGGKSFTVSLSQPQGGVSLVDPVNAVVRMESSQTSPGALDKSFDPGTGASDLVSAAVVQSDGKIVIGGAFTNFNNVPHNYFARLNTNGSLDASFLLPAQVIQTNGTVLVTNQVGVGGNGLVSSLGMLSNGKIVLGGSFTSINGTNRNHVVLLTTNGLVDPYFSPPLDLNAAVSAVLVQTDGKVFVGGAFSAPVPGLARLKAGGALDVSFAPGSGVNGSVFCIAMQTNGQVLVGGSFSAVGGVPMLNVARLNADGGVDLSFAPVVSGGPVFALAVQQDGRILVGGGFTNVNGQSCGGLARLDTAGLLDTSFGGGAGANGVIYGMGLYRDGRIVIGGSFTTYNGILRNRVARLTADGGLDLAFDPGLGADDTVLAVAILPYGKVLIGGEFATVDGYDRHGVAVLNGDPIPPLRMWLPVALGSGVLGLTADAASSLFYVLDSSTDTRSWTPVQTNVAIGPIVSFSVTNSPAAGWRFYRARIPAQ